MEGHPEGCEEHGKFFVVVDLLLVDAQIVYWDLITNALYRLLLVMSVKNQVGSHFPFNLSCIQSQFIHRGIMWGLTLLALLLLLLPAAIGLSLHFQTTTLNG